MIFDWRPTLNAKGLRNAIYAYAAWGLLPLYWKRLADVPAFETLNHRIFWLAATSVLALSLLKRWPDLKKTCSSPLLVFASVTTALVIACNWLTYIWAVSNDFILETSLGYFINPLLTVLLAVILLKERLRRLQVLAVALAFVGVIYMTLVYGRFPWIALVLASTFAIYGLIRKVAPASPLMALSTESFVLALPCLAVIFYLQSKGQGHLVGSGWSIPLLLALAGPVTFLPLFWFSVAAKKMPLATIGILQYIAPSLQFLLAVFWFREAFTVHHLVTFLFIWIALAIYTGESVWMERRARPRLRDPA